MRFRTATVIVGINLVILVSLVFAYPHLMIAPGKPMSAHAELATDCFACHTPLLGSRSEKCVACHAVDEIGLRTTSGLLIAGEKKNVAFHRQLIEEECIACHSEHRGVRAFRPIGRFSHELLEPAVRAECAGCHAAPDDSLHRLIEGNCGSCHAQQAWTPAEFDHDRYFRFDEDHRTDCATCHVGSDFRDYTCYGCHEHSRSNIREEHVEEGIFDFEECAECHRSGDEDEAKRLWRQRDRGITIRTSPTGRDRDGERRDDDD